MPSSSYVSRSQLAPSKPIAIKHNEDHFFVEDQEDLEENEKQFYECATWRMYNRIVDHRLHSPPQQAIAPIHHGSAGCSPIHGHANNNCSPQQGQLIRPQPRYARAPTLMPMLDQQQHQPFAMGGLPVHDQHNDDMNHLFDEEIFELEL